MSSLARPKPFLSAIIIVLFVIASRGGAQTIDMIELPNEGGVQIFTDGSLLNFILGSERYRRSQLQRWQLHSAGDQCGSLRRSFTFLRSDRITITVPAANPPQITVGLTSDSEGLFLSPQTPEDVALTETGGLQVITTLTNSSGVQTTIRVQSDLDPRQ